jgi:dihydrofolate synthase/folylpolyglutamate synthase
MTQLAEINHTSLHIVWGMVKDKDHDKVLKLLPPHATYYFVAAPLPRSLPPNELASKAQSYGLEGQAYPSVEEGTQAAIQAAQKEKQPLVFIGGSTFVIGEVLKNPRSYNGRGWDR